MQLNSNGYYKGILSYVISADDTAEAGVVCRMYEESLKKEEIFEKISEMTAEGKKAKYYEELLEISEILGDSAAKTEISVEADKMAVFTVAFSHNDEQMCRAVLSFLEEKISRVSEEITSAKEGHELLLFSKDIAVMDNKEIVSKKQQIAQEQINILNQISNIENGMSEEQASYYRMIKNGENGSEGQEETAQTVPEINFKYMIFGMSAGGILAAAWLAFFYIADRRLHTKTDVYVLTDEKVLAVCTVPDNKKRIFSGIDNAIKKMISKRDGFGNSSEMLEFQLEEYARRTKIQELYLVGSRMNCDDDCIRFVEQLNPKGISLKSAQNFLENVTERKAVIENGHAVLIEMIGRTECSALQEETGVLADYGVNLAGIVLLR